jgi:Putative transposase
VLASLGRYTQRVALSNDRLLAVIDGRVHFRWRDYADGNRVKVMDLEGELAMAAEEEGEEPKQVEQEGNRRAGIVSGSRQIDQPLDRRT